MEKTVLHTYLFHLQRQSSKSTLKIKKFEFEIKTKYTLCRRIASSHDLWRTIEFCRVINNPAKSPMRTNLVYLWPIHVWCVQLKVRIDGNSRLAHAPRLLRTSVQSAVAKVEKQQSRVTTGEHSRSACGLETTFSWLYIVWLLAATVLLRLRTI